MFSCEICEFLKNTFFQEHLRTTALHFLCKPCLEKLPKGLCKICQLYTRIPYNSYFGKSIKSWSQSFQRKRLIIRFHFSKLGCCTKPTLPKKHYIKVFFWNLENFLRISTKHSSSCITQITLRKEFKQVLQRRVGGTGVAMELLEKTKWAISNILL